MGKIITGMLKPNAKENVTVENVGVGVGVSFGGLQKSKWGSIKQHFRIKGQRKRVTPRLSTKVAIIERSGNIPRYLQPIFC